MTRANPSKSSRFTFDRRASGVLMHVTSLPGGHGSGDLGPEAYKFVDFLQSAGQSWWQMLPVNPPGDGWSPYSCSSTFAGSPWLISLDLLVRDGLLKKRELTHAGVKFREDRADFEASVDFRRDKLRLAYERFKKTRGGKARLDAFIRKHASWLDDYTIFSALRDAFAGKSWNTWTRDLKLREPAAIADARRVLADDIRFHAFSQYIFDQQWNALREYAHANGVGLIGDIPIFVAYDSSDVWAHRELFLLDREGEPRFISGCPPDAFNDKGQVWNHPHYDWKRHRATKFAWWISRFAETLRLFDGVRIDHFLGFHRVWKIPYGAEDAVRGQWELTPGVALFTALRDALGRPPIIAEDLGLVTQEAARLRDQFEFPSMRVLQFAFGGDSGHMPHNLPPRSVLYTGTHDNDTSVGFFAMLEKNGRKNRHDREQVARMRRYTNSNGDGSTLHWNLIRTAMSGPSNTVIVPTQDILGLGTEARMNLPGTTLDNWLWRVAPGALKPQHAKKLREFSETYERIPRSV